MLEHFAASRFDANRVGQWEDAQKGGNRTEHRRRDSILVVDRQRGHETNFHVCRRRCNSRSVLGRHGLPEIIPSFAIALVYGKRPVVDFGRRKSARQTTSSSEWRLTCHV